MTQNAHATGLLWGIKDLHREMKGSKGITALPSAPGSGRVQLTLVASSLWEPLSSSLAAPG